MNSPPVTPEQRKSPAFTDATEIHLFESIGGTGPTLCLYDHHRGYMEQPGQSKAFHRAVIATADKRYMTDLFRENPPYYVWLDKSGMIISVKSYNVEGMIQIECCSRICCSGVLRLRV
jgi:hypothetical protein